MIFGNVKGFITLKKTKKRRFIRLSTSFYFFILLLGVFIGIRYQVVEEAHILQQIDNNIFARKNWLNCGIN